MAQASFFQNGGFVLHKIRLEGSPRKFSAWFSTAGVLLSAEGYDAKDRGAAPGARQIRALERLGPIYRKATPLECARQSTGWAYLGKMPQAVRCYSEAVAGGVVFA